jgi:hypothetical protein
MKNVFLILIFSALFAGCSNTSMLTVQTLYMTRESLASYYVGTPDPQQLNPPVGQKLLVSWNVPQGYLAVEDLYLNIRIRFRNHQEVVVDHPICKRSGTYSYEIANEDYFACKGILTYKVDLIGDGAVLEEWKQQLWHEVIRIGEEE